MQALSGMGAGESRVLLCWALYPLLLRLSSDWAEDPGQPRTVADFLGDVLPCLEGGAVPLHFWASFFSVENGILQAGLALERGAEQGMYVFGAHRMWLV